MAHHSLVLRSRWGTGSNRLARLCPWLTSLTALISMERQRTRRMLGAAGPASPLASSEAKLRLTNLTSAYLDILRQKMFLYFTNLIYLKKNWFKEDWKILEIHSAITPKITRPKACYLKHFSTCSK